MHWSRGGQKWRRRQRLIERRRLRHCRSWRGIGGGRGGSRRRRRHGRGMRRRIHSRCTSCRRLEVVVVVVVVQRLEEVEALLLQS